MKNIVISHLSKAYGGKKVLEDFSAVLEPGAVTALMAPSGGGKTTLLRILMGLEAADSGTVEGLENLKISAVFQEDRLCPGLDPVANIRLVNPSVGAEAVMEAMREIGLTDCFHQKTRELSGGMKRRVAILRALLAEYDLLLLDEPVRGLDKETKALVMDFTRQHCQDRTVLLVTHDITELAAMGIQSCLHF